MKEFPYTEYTEALDLFTRDVRDDYYAWLCFDGFAQECFDKDQAVWFLLLCKEAK